MYSLLQFVDDGILAICTPKNIRKRDDGRKEAQYGDEYYLCTVMFESDESFSLYKLFSYLNTSEIPGELSCENMLSSHVKIPNNMSFSHVE